MKTCCRCKKNKSLLEFNKCKKGRLGLHNHCRDCQREVKRLWYLDNIDYQKTVSAEYNKSPEGIAARKRRYDKNKDRLLEKNRIARRTDHARKLANAARKRKLDSDPSFKIGQNLRSRIRHALTRQLYKEKKEHLKDVLGCTFAELKIYLESKFKDGMTWQNYGTRGWHVDHILPCDSFDLSQESERRKCFHYTNLQPLWWNENISKGNKTI